MKTCSKLFPILNGRCIGWLILISILCTPFLASRSFSRKDTNGAVVLTFDDAVKSHRTVVAPLLKELGFGATFFVTHRWMANSKEFLTWREIAEIHRMGFEIGNHSWTHPDFSIPKNAARLPAELALVEYKLRKVGVPRPISFAYSGNAFGPEAVKQLKRLGYKLARRGMQPEVPYGKAQVGPVFDPQRHHRLLVPSTGDAYPNWTLEHFRRVVAPAQEGRIVLLQFHGVPDPAHSWVHTPPERFREYMNYLKEQGLRVIALRDLQRYLPDMDSSDPLLEARYPESRKGKLELPTEVRATRADLAYWLENMLRYHRYSWEEASEATGLSAEVLKKHVRELGVKTSPFPPRGRRNPLLLPYPGGRHPRIGFLEGAVSPQRGTKASLFLPWSESGYAVVDLPEAVFSNLGLIFLAHTHIPTLWQKQNVWLENVDWERHPDGSLSGSRELPNKISFGASIRPSTGQVEMELWLHNGSREHLSALRTQVCIMLKGAPTFATQTNDNKIFHSPVAAVRSAEKERWILTAWDRCGRVWGNPQVPCFHSDPLLPDCAPGETVRLRGRIWFYEGSHIEGEIERTRRLFTTLPP
ncbi:polysaccharide deacetylase family protein [Acidobacteria bacterium AH-259-G07]|nr:polysaccharide deacetylase family protein [Acidobacteria bacterium AH-259-G07]